MRNIPVLTFVATILISLPCYAGKEMAHFISLPFIEGAGIYSSVASLTDDNAGGSTKAASITNLALLGTNGALGVVAMLSNNETRMKMRTTHRIVGFAITAASLWLAVSGSVDNTATPAKVFSYAYSGMSVVPLIMFKF